MRSGAFKSGIYLALTVAIAVGGATQAWTTPFRLDRLAFERIHQPTERQASLDWMARLTDTPGQDIAVDADTGLRSPWVAGRLTTRGLDSWRLARLEPLASGPDEPTKAVEEIRMVRLRPSAGALTGGVNSIDADMLLATPGGSPISDAYDFAGVDPRGFAPITPVEIKKQRQPKPPGRETLRLLRPNEVLDLSVRTLDYMMLTTKIFVENISRMLKNLL